MLACGGGSGSGSGSGNGSGNGEGNNYSETILHSFQGASGDGAEPLAGLTMDSAGNLYGTTWYGGINGGAYGGGVAFKLDTSNHETILYNFPGSSLSMGLITDSLGNLYGTTQYGGSSGIGEVFKLDSLDQETTLYSFGPQASDGSLPNGGLTKDNAGNLYGSTFGGGFNAGTVFKLNSYGNETILYKFLYWSPNNIGADGGYPAAGLVMDGSGNLYGTTEVGGSTSPCPTQAGPSISGAADLLGCGTVFKVDTTGQEIVFYAFTGLNGDGAYPTGGLILDSAGNLYGTTSEGGISGNGTVFKIDSSGHETVLHMFAGSNGDGVSPSGSLVMDAAGNLYGTTFGQQHYGFPPSPGGIAFKLNSQGQETVLHTFTGTNGDGVNPIGGLIIDSAGNLYGNTQYGGIAPCPSSGGFGCGIVYKLTP